MLKGLKGKTIAEVIEEIGVDGLQEMLEKETGLNVTITGDIEDFLIKGDE